MPSRETEAAPLIDIADGPHDHVFELAYSRHDHFKLARIQVTGSASKSFLQLGTSEAADHIPFTASLALIPLLSFYLAFCYFNTR